MISFRQYIQEVFSGGDRGFSYTKDDNKHDEYPDPNRTKYNVSLPDHVAPAIVSFKHSKKWAVDAEWDKKEDIADVSFTMPRRGYNIKPEEKETYDKAVNDHIDEPDEEFRQGHGISAVKDKHGDDAGERVRQALDSPQSYRGSGQAKHHNFGMFATVKKIMDEHGKKNPHIKHFEFSSSTNDSSRIGAYARIARVHGGTVDDYGTYTIPNPHHKETSEP